jgi:hypothetical protein
VEAVKDLECGACQRRVGAVVTRREVYERIAQLHQLRAFVGRWILGATNGAAVIPDTYRLQAGDADETTSFDNQSMFHEASLERPPGSGNALFG